MGNTGEVKRGYGLDLNATILNLSLCRRNFKASSIPRLNSLRRQRPMLPEISNRKITSLLNVGNESACLFGVRSILKKPPPRGTGYLKTATSIKASILVVRAGGKSVVSGVTGSSPFVASGCLCGGNSMRIGSFTTELGAPFPLPKEGNDNSLPGVFGGSGIKILSKANLSGGRSSPFIDTIDGGSGVPPGGGTESGIGRSFLFLPPVPAVAPVLESGMGSGMSLVETDGVSGAANTGFRLGVGIATGFTMPWGIMRTMWLGRFGGVEIMLGKNETCLNNAMRSR